MNELRHSLYSLFGLCILHSVGRRIQSQWLTMWVVSVESFAPELVSPNNWHLASSNWPSGVVVK
jgi:hypothetical protein